MSAGSIRHRFKLAEAAETTLRGDKKEKKKRKEGTVISASIITVCRSYDGYCTACCAEKYEYFLTFS